MSFESVETSGTLLVSSIHPVSGVVHARPCVRTAEEKRRFSLRTRRIQAIARSGCRVTLELPERDELERAIERALSVFLDDLGVPPAAPAIWDALLAEVGRRGDPTLVATQIAELRVEMPGRTEMPVGFNARLGMLSPHAGGGIASACDLSPSLQGLLDRASSRSRRPISIGVMVPGWSWGAFEDQHLAVRVLQVAIDHSVRSAD